MGSRPEPQPLRKLRDLGTVEAEARSNLERVAFAGAFVLTLVDHIREAYARYEEMRADRDQWRNNHDEAVRRKRVAEEYRDDFRSRAIAAEERSAELEKRVTELEAKAE